jgi:pimeloyl-ACP methyl ester carboxylesterase
VNKVRSSDGTAIAFDRLGDGPPVVLVCGASTDRMANASLAKLLAERFTVFNYDRRGRGDSDDPAPYAVEHEVEDIGAVIDVAGGSVFVYGTSSGGALALEAAASSPSQSWRCGSRRSSSTRVADRQQTWWSATTR